MIQVPFSLGVILLVVIISQGLFAALLLILQRKNQLANRFLGALLLVFSLWLGDSFFRLANIYAQDPNFYFLPIYYSLAFGPLLYFYTLAICYKDFRLRSRHYLHFLPVFLQASLYLFLQLQDYSFRRWFWLEVHRPFSYNLEFHLSLGSLIIYSVLSLRILKTYQGWIKNNYSEISMINLKWLRLVQLGLILISLLWLGDSLLREMWDYYPSQNLSSISMGFMVLALGLGASLQSHLGESGMPLTRTPLSSSPYQIDPQVLTKIQEEMKKGAYYLQPDLSLESFSQAIHLSPRLISFHLNTGLGLSFIEFVNRYRVEAVKENLTKPKYAHLTLLGIALESGFNSKSSFNRVFKNMTGHSPSSFQKRSQNR